MYFANNSLIYLIGSALNRIHFIIKHFKKNNLQDTEVQLAVSQSLHYSSAPSQFLTFEEKKQF